MNAKIEKFEDLTVWQESMVLAENIYLVFNQCNDYGFRDQIRRAVISIPANIAEGFDRQTNKELIHFLYISKGSAAEVKTFLYLGMRLKYLDKNTGESFLNNIRKISAMLYK